MVKILYKPLGMIVSVIGGLLATRVFNAIWKGISHQEEPPSSTDAGRGWSEVLLAATLQGAVFGLVKALTDRSGAIGFRRATGAWPGDE